MAMSLENIYNIDVLVRTNKKTGYEIVSTKQLIKDIASTYGKLSKISIDTLKLSEIRQDFCILSIMMGNDYLPKMYFVEFNNLWETYKIVRQKTHRYLTKKNSFDMVFLYMFLDTLLSNKPAHFKKPNKTYSSVHCKNYLEGLLWCLEMYKKGECPMYDFVFEDISSPHPANILHYLDTSNTKSISLPTSDTKPLKTNTCGILLLPKSAKELLNKKYHALMDKELKKFYQIEECDTCTQFKKDIDELLKIHTIISYHIVLLQF